MQILFDFKTPKPEKEAKQYQIRQTIRRATIKWLLDMEPQARPAIGIDVPTRGNMFKADIAAAWFQCRRIKTPNGRFTMVQEPSRTTLVICSASRQDCWPECADAERLLTEIATLKQELRDVEQRIRDNEPELRDHNMLFDEFAVWNYTATKDKNYHKLVKQISHLENTLFRGSRLAKLGGSMTANEIYLAVPKNTITPDEVITSWGLLEIDMKTLEVFEIKKAEPMSAIPELQHHLAMVIAECNTRQLADCHGLRINDNAPTTVLKMPTFHRATSSPNGQKKH
ncbi:MAG: hypothetical protein J6X55_13730 [Victivallales bacterium]|nr:hypothetical protein [Victivallales bacterium]